MTFSHPLSKYGLAYIFLEESIDSIEYVTPQILSKYLREGLNHFRISTKDNPTFDDELHYDFLSFQYIIDNNQKGNPSKGIFLSPNIITTDLQASNCWSAIKGLIEELENIKNKEELFSRRKDLTQSLAPISGKINNGSNSQTTPQASLLEVSCCAIATVTPEKPCKLVDLNPSAIIPDLDINAMVDFINVFKRIRTSETKDLMKVTLRKPFDKKDKEKTVKITFKRPNIINGNFPDAPSNNFFNGLALLAAIGKWAKSAEDSSKGLKVLESLTDVPIYTIQHGDANSFKFNHFVIGLAKENRLNSIISGLLRASIYSEDFRSYDNTKYKLFDFLANRFLQLFNKASFKDFLSIRAEYPIELETLFTSYFKNYMKIRPEIVDSAKELGLWLNYIAFKTAQEETKDKPDKLNDLKNKFLVEMESATFGAKSNTSVLTIITRAGRLSGKDAPAEADEFMKAILTEEITVEDGKNMIMAYMRLKNRYEQKSNNNSIVTTLDEINDIPNSLSDTQH